MFFNHAAGLLALLGLAVPVAIHLWNRRPGRTVQVGSVRWLAATANRRLRNLRLEQWGLLLLRMAVVALLALAVAQPHWLRPQPPRPVRGVVLVAPDVLRPDVLPAVRPVVDSLRRRRYELRLLGPSFRAVSDTAWAAPDSLAALHVGLNGAGQNHFIDDYWARARQAADSFPSRPLHVLSGAGLRHFAGPRPALPARLSWQLVPLPDSATWLAAATAPHPDTLRLLVGRSRAEATIFQQLSLPRPRGTGVLPVKILSGLRYTAPTAGRPAAVHRPGQAAVPVQATPLRAVVYADAAHAASARYLQAALRAAALGLAQPLDLRVASPETPLPARPDWLFWLSDQPAPPTWRAHARRGARLWQEAAGPGAAAASALDLTGLADAPTVALRRLDTAAVSNTSQVLWQDGTGRAVLTRQAAGRGAFYRLRTRLQPAWNDLPNSPALPALLLALLRPPYAPDVHDLRQLDARQLGVSPAANGAKANLAATPDATLPLAYKTVDLRPWAVLAAALLFGLERAWAHRRAAAVSVPVSSAS